MCVAGARFGGGDAPCRAAERKMKLKMGHIKMIFFIISVSQCKLDCVTSIQGCHSFSPFLDHIFVQEAVTTRMIEVYDDEERSCLHFAAMYGL